MIRSKLANPKQKRLRKCKVCRVNPVANQMASVCGFECSLKKVEMDNLKKAAKREQEERAKTRVQKEAIKTRPKLLAELQVVFNAYIRARDADQLCICCGKPFEPQKPGGSVDAGHYLSRGSASHLRFNENNVFAQRKNCNRPGGTTRAAFRAGVEARIGIEALEALEADQADREYTKDDLRSMKALYRSKLKQLLADKEVGQ